ncbi:MAG TPA: copper resistance CopC family protein [Gaiellaceae bacterium]|nr:copper resistance CopC family protein [Gaiellaceae bacterium]
MKALLAAVLLALALPAAAAAHATLLRTLPADGAVLQRAPAAVRVVFDDTVETGPGIAAIRNGGGSVLAGKPHVSGGKTLVVPLRPGLGDGAYTVRWAIVSDDGHLESGVVAFAVGRGSAPVAALGAEATGPQAGDVVSRWLFFLGVLGAVGTGLAVLVGRVESPGVPLALATAAVLAALGGAEEASRVGLGTRAGAAFVAGSVFAVVVALAAAAATLERRALRPAVVLALGLVAVPTAAGHALDNGLPRLNVAADLLHVAGAAAWAGALLGLVLGGPPRRLVRLAVAGVLVLGVTGVVRALYELLHVSQLWETGYGRTLLVKTGILLAALAAGWLVRGRIRRRAGLELVLVAGLLVAVGVLVLQKPGRNVVAAVAAPPPSAPASNEPLPPPVAPPPGSVVTARALGVYGVALAAEPRRTTVLVLSPAGGGLTGADVTVDGRTAASCGQGCYRVAEPPGRTVSVTVNGSTGTFVPHLGAPAADALVRRLRERYRAFESVEYVERLASSPTQAITARWRLQAPSSLAYEIRGGASAIAIGGTRWDRGAGSSRWVRSPQTPLSMPAPQWNHESNAHLIGRGRVAFVDQSVPAYFTVDFDPRTLRPRLLRMTAAAHFMTDRYVRFDSGPALRPPR